VRLIRERGVCVGVDPPHLRGWARKFAEVSQHLVSAMRSQWPVMARAAVPFAAFVKTRLVEPKKPE